MAGAGITMGLGGGTSGGKSRAGAGNARQSRSKHAMLGTRDTRHATRDSELGNRAKLRIPESADPAPLESRIGPPCPDSLIPSPVSRVPDPVSRFTRLFPSPSCLTKK